MSDEWNKAAFDMLVAMRGGVPEKCDFCGQPYGADRYPVPEEGQAWACSDCLKRWGESDPGDG